MEMRNAGGVVELTHTVSERLSQIMGTHMALSCPGVQQATVLNTSHCAKPKPLCQTQATSKHKSRVNMFFYLSWSPDIGHSCHVCSWLTYCRGCSLQLCSGSINYDIACCVYFVELAVVWF